MMDQSLDLKIESEEIHDISVPSDGHNSTTSDEIPRFVQRMIIETTVYMYPTMRYTCIAIG